MHENRKATGSGRSGWGWLRAGCRSCECRSFPSCNLHSIAISVRRYHLLRGCYVRSAPAWSAHLQGPPAYVLSGTKRAEICFAILFSCFCPGPGPVPVLVPVASTPVCCFLNINIKRDRMDFCLDKAQEALRMAGRMAYTRGKGYVTEICLQRHFPHSKSLKNYKYLDKDGKY